MVRQAAAELVPILAADVDDVIRVLLLLLLLLELVLGRYHLPRTGQAGQIRWRRLLLEPVAIGSDAGPVRQEGLLMERVAVVVVVVLVESFRVLSGGGGHIRAHIRSGALVTIGSFTGTAFQCARSFVVVDDPLVGIVAFVFVVLVVVVVVVVMVTASCRSGCASGPAANSSGSLSPHGRRLRSLRYRKLLPVCDEMSESRAGGDTDLPVPAQQPGTRRSQLVPAFRFASSRSRLRVFSERPKLCTSF
uniref:Uncharacterized protein n=1 Tax=Anopheles coluzzii TaxID=1518534 RepID=A0A8W7PCW0_ANOCL